MKRARTVWGLGVMAVLAGGLVVWDRGRPTTDESRAQRGRLAPGFVREQVAALDIAHAGAPPIRLEREAGGWWLVSPKRRADDAKVEAILSQLDFGSIERRVTMAAGERAGVGLDEAAPRLRLTAGAVTIAIGADAPGERHVYAARAGEREVLVVDRRLLEVVELDRAQLTSRRPVLLPVDEARAIAIGELALARTATAWRLERPFSARARTEAVERLLAAFGATAVRLLEDPALASAPHGRSIRFDGHEQARVGAGAACGASEVEVARADGQALCFAAAALSPLEAPASSLRETALLPIPPGDVRALDVERDGARLSLRRDDGGWRIVAPGSASGPADDASVREWLEALARRRAGSFGPAPAGGTRLRVAGGADEVELTVRGHAARGRGEPDALVFAEPLDELVAPDPARVRPRRIFSFSVDEATRLTAEEGGVTEEAVREGGSARLVRPIAAAADAEVVGRALTTLSLLRAERFVPAAPLALVRRVTVRAGARDYSVELGARDDTGCFARAPDVPPFRLSRASCDDLYQRLATRSVLEVAGDRLLSVAVTGARVRWQVERREGGWFAGERRLEASRVDALYAALRALAADEVVGYGAPVPHAGSLLRVGQRGAPEVVLEIGDRKGGHALVRRRDLAILWRVPVERIEAIERAVGP